LTPDSFYSTLKAIGLSPKILDPTSTVSDFITTAKKSNISKIVDNVDQYSSNAVVALLDVMVTSLTYKYELP
jgi:hypothetical protein